MNIKTQSTFASFIAVLIAVSLILYPVIGNVNVQQYKEQHSIHPHPLLHNNLLLQKETAVQHIPIHGPMGLDYQELLDKSGDESDIHSAISQEGVTNTGIQSQNANTMTLHHEIKPVTHNQNQTVDKNNNGFLLHPEHINKNSSPSHLANQFTQTNIQKALLWNKQFIHQPGNGKWIAMIHDYQQQYQNKFYANSIQRYKAYDHYWRSNYFHNWYSPWYQWGFYGGNWYPVRPFFSITDYFDYPEVQWFFVDEPQLPDYYKAYYTKRALLAGLCAKPFPYKHVYFPTDTLKDLLIEVSGFTGNLCCNFRMALLTITSQLQQVIHVNFAIPFSFEQNDIIINYYQNLKNKAIVIAGFVNHNKINIAFEAYLDLENPATSIAFAPMSQIPTDDQLAVLKQLNNRIEVMGGDPFTAQEEPDAGIENSGADLHLPSQ